MFTLFRRRLLKYIPPSWRHRVVEFKNTLWGGWKHNSYAHCGEDVVIDAFFRSKKQGFYIDIGAHHPERYSNTALLYKRGWKGINVDPDSSLMNAFYRKRKHDINLNIGVALEEGSLTLHRFSDPAFNTFSPENADRVKKKAWVSEISAEKISVKPLSLVLDKYLSAYVVIDVLNIDVEDLDLEVLQSNNWDKYRPKLIAIEDLNFNPIHPENSEIYSYLINRQYIFLAYIGLTLLLVDRSYLEERNNKR